MGCATGLVKYLVFLANLIFALAGLALVIIGIMYKLNYNDATRVLPNDFGLAPILSIIIGAIVFVTAFLGCCGAVKESPCMLTTYATILLIIFILQVAIGVYAFLQIKNTDQLHTTLRKKLQETFDKYTQENQHNEEAKETVELTQRFLECCGLDNWDQMKLPNDSLPLSCCKRGVEHCRTPNFYDVHNKGCARALLEYVENNSQVIGGVAIGIAILEIIGAVFGFCLASSIRNHHRRNIYT